MKTKLVVLVSGVTAALLLVVIVARTTSEPKESRAPSGAPDASTAPKVPIFTVTEADKADENEAVRNAARAISGGGKVYIPPRQERLLYSTMGRKHEFQASENVLQRMGLPEEKVDRLRKFLNSEVEVIVELIEKHFDEPPKQGVTDPAEERHQRVVAVLQQELGDRYSEFRSAQIREWQKLIREYGRKHNLKPSSPPQ